MTDTAEYWEDVKSHFRRNFNKRVFIHYKGLNCGHYHVKETIKMNDVDCYACKELIKKSLEANENYDKELQKIHQPPQSTVD